MVSLADARLLFETAAKPAKKADKPKKSTKVQKVYIGWSTGPVIDVNDTKGAAPASEGVLIDGELEETQGVSLVVRTEKNGNFSKFFIPLEYIQDTIEAIQTAAKMSEVQGEYDRIFIHRKKGGEELKTEIAGTGTAKKVQKVKKSAPAKSAPKSDKPAVDVSQYDCPVDGCKRVGSNGLKANPSSPAFKKHMVHTHGLTEKVALELAQNIDTDFTSSTQKEEKSTTKKSDAPQVPDAVLEIAAKAQEFLKSLSAAGVSIE